MATIIDLGTFSPPLGQPYATNEVGQVAGWSVTGHAYVYTPGQPEPVEDLNPLVGGSSSGSVASGINDAGQVVGMVSDRSSSPPYHAFIYTPGKSPTDLSVFLGPVGSYAYDINNSGQVVGGYDTADGSSHAFLYTPGQPKPITDLGSLLGATVYSTAWAINDAGQVVGDYLTADGSDHAYLYTPGQPKPTDLGTLPGGSFSEAFGINSSGQVVGLADAADGSGHAFLYTKEKGMVDLGNPTGGRDSTAWAINDAGQVVGTYATVADGQQHSFLYTKAKGLVDLDTLLPEGSWVLGTFAINNHGQIVGDAEFPDGSTHVVVVSLDPDLSVTSPTWSSDGGVDFSYSISGGDLPEATTVGLYWSDNPDPTYDPDMDKLAYSTTTQTAQSNDPYQVSVSPSDFVSIPPKGYGYLKAVIDPDDSVQESDSEDDTNNVASLAIPDVEPTSLTWRPSTTSDWVKDANAGGVDVSYTISMADLARGVPIVLYWVDSSGNKLPGGGPITRGDDGTPLLTKTMVNPPSQPYKAHVPASRLGAPPVGAVGLLAEIDPPDSPQYVPLVHVDNSRSANNTLDASPSAITSNAVHVKVSGARIDALFMPASGLTQPDSSNDLTKAAGSLTVEQAAVICGVDHFNWTQRIFLPPEYVAYSLTLDSAYTATIDLGGIEWRAANVYKTATNQVFAFVDSNGDGKSEDDEPAVDVTGQLTRLGSGYLDPLQQTGSGTTFVLFDAGDGALQSIALQDSGIEPGWQGPDTFQYYNDEKLYRFSYVGQKDGHYGLSFDDTPVFSSSLLDYIAGESTLFTTLLSGVAGDAAHSAVHLPGSNSLFEWQSDAVYFPFNHVFGGVSRDVRFVNFMSVVGPSMLPPVASGGASLIGFVNSGAGQPILDPIGNSKVKEGSTLTFTASASDPDPSAKLTYRLDPGAPAGASIDPTSGAFTWNVPVAQAPGDYPVTVRVTDGGSPPLSATASFKIHVIPVLQPTTIASVSGSGTYGGAGVLTATLTSNGAPLAGKPVTFTLYAGGTATTVGTATTDPNGVATLTGVSLAGLHTGTYSGAVAASFAQDTTNAGSQAGGDLTVGRARPTVRVTGGEFTYDATAHPPTGQVIGVGLDGVLAAPSFGYTDRTDGSHPDAPVQAGTYDVLGSFSGNGDYELATGTGTVVIDRATPSFIDLNATPTVVGAGSTMSVAYSGVLSYGRLVPTGQVALALGGVPQGSAAIGPGGRFSQVAATPSRAAGSYPVAVSYAGDRNFNPVSGATTLVIRYTVDPHYDPTQAHQSGSTVPLRVQLFDAAGNNAGSAGTAVIGVLVVGPDGDQVPLQAPGNSDPDSLFRYDPSTGTYQLNVKTTRYAPGRYTVYFTVGNEQTRYDASFLVR